ncbi:DNA polymerase III subunit alpha [Gammaproteobacteria bacterium]|nr:DNA polymerase III subunit alpha [SAR86 cluster bacterium]MDC0577677.1 DNA polymerase III subunit alpha [Gammaproteobacteria bacterium]
MSQINKLDFVHLHLHSEYSLVDGIIRVDELVEHSLNHGYHSVALTDLTNLFGLIGFYRSARNKGIKPIVGAEINVAKDMDSLCAPLVLLAMNKQGYINLTKLVSKAYVEGQINGEPIVLFSWLEEFSDGIIALSGGMEGHIGNSILAGNKQLSESRVDFFKNIFKENFFIEIQRLGKPNEKEYNDSVLQLASDKQIPVVATNNVRFLNPADPEISPSDFEAHEARVCIQRGETLDDPRRPKNYTEQQFFRSKEEMINLFADLPEALINTVKIAEKCNIDLELGKFYLPDFEVPEEFSREEFLRKLSKEGLLDRIKEIESSVDFYKIDESQYIQRLDYELDMICKLDFAGYFLIVADFVNWAQKNDIPVGPGRGSGAGSIVAYSLGITAIDPIRYDLLFERFLNPERVSNPDFDIDFCIEGRDKVLEYVTNKYGKDSVAQISTRGTMAARAVLRDVVRVLGKPYGFGDRLAKAIPDVLGISLEEAFEEKQFKETIEESDESKEVFDMALKLEGLSRSVGTHAAGVVIAPTALTDFTPLFLDSDKGTVASQFDMGDVESAGLVKFDFLGLKTLTVIDQSVRRINSTLKEKEEKLNIDNLSLKDQKTFELLQRGETTAIFQLESKGMRDYLKQLIPNDFEDIVSMNALYRPGALGMNMVDSYINRKHGKEEVTYGHESVKKILGTTYGVIVYQEQVMQIAQELSGFSLGQADILRRAMGKKKKEEMESLRSTFVDGAVKKDVNERYAANLFDQIEQFAGYGFNRSHSVGYALIAYQTAWLKAHYPAEFMASVLSCDLGNTDNIQLFVDDCKNIGLTVLSPDINQSSYKFENPDNKTILYGLGAIKGIGESLVDKIISERAEEKFKDMYDFCLRVGFRRINRRILTTLIGSGAMDTLGKRQDLFARIDSCLKNAEQASERDKSNIRDLFGEEIITPEISEIDDEVEFDEVSAEWSALGFYLDSHPLENKKKEVRNMCGFFISELQSETHNQRISGCLIQFNVRSGRRGRFAFATLDDGSGKIEVSIWADAFEKYRNLLKKGQVLVVEGMVEKDAYSDSQRHKMIAERILTFDQARREFVKNIKIDIEDSANTKDIVGSLKEIANSDDGNLVLISYKGNTAKADIVLPKNFSVNLDDSSIKALDKRFGAENVEFVYHSQIHIN